MVGGRDPFSFDWHPAIAILDVGSLDCRPSGAVSDLFLPNVSRMGCEGMVERGSIDVLRMRRKMVADRCRKIDIGAVRHGFPDEGLLVRKYQPRLLPMNGRILRALLPDDQPASAFPTDTRLSAYCAHGRLRREVHSNFRYLRRRVRAM